MSTRPATRPSLSLRTVSFSSPMSSTLGPSICHSCAMGVSLRLGRWRPLAIRVISRSAHSRYNAMYRECNPLNATKNRRQEHPGAGPFGHSATEVQPLVPATVQHQPGDQPIAGLAGVDATGRAQVRVPLLMADQWPVTVDVGNTATSTHVR